MAGPAALNPGTPPEGGLDHDLYDARRSDGADASAWPGGQAAAACVVIHVEALELDPPPGAVRDPGLAGGFGTFHPALRMHSEIEYGNRIGVFRLLDILQPLGWSVSLAVNGLVAAERPSLVRSLEARGVELLASGWSASRMITGAMPETDERELLARSVDALAQATGRQPRGYSSQDHGYSANTPALLEALAVTHAVDWPNDERPFLFGPTRKLVMLPAAGELDDAQAMLARRMQARAWGEALDAALDWWSHRALTGAVFALPLHAWLAGAPHRAAVLRRTLRAHAADRFWQASPSAIADAWRGTPRHADVPQPA